MTVPPQLIYTSKITKTPACHHNIIPPDWNIKHNHWSNEDMKEYITTIIPYAIIIK